MRGFAQRAGGRASIASAPGRGTTVAIHLPAVEPVAAEPSGDAHRGAIVMVVEDSGPMRALARTYLTEFGYRTETAESAEAAIALLRDGRPVDLLFTDLVLSGALDGRELARVAMRLRPGLKCLITTGGDDASIDGLPVLPKPYRKDALAQAVQQCLGGPRWPAMTRIGRLVDELGPATALLYLAGRALARFGNAMALHDLLLYVQLVRATPLLPPQRGASIEVRALDGDTALASGLPCPPQHAAARRRGGVHCLAAYSGGALIGFHWIALGPHDDEMVRCRYLPLPDSASAWSFDLQIEPAHRGGFAYTRLADATAALLRGHGRTHVASYIEAYNRGAIAAEERLGGRRIGRAVHLRLGPLQLLLASVAPYLHLSLSGRHPPVVRIGEST